MISKSVYRPLLSGNAQASSMELSERALKVKSAGAAGRLHEQMLVDLMLSIPD